MAAEEYYTARRWFPAGLWALLRQRCPRCRKGKMFRGSFAMNDPCPECGLLFQREEGYFLGAMYVSYLLGVLILVPFFYLFTWLLPNWAGYWVSLLALLPYVLFIPAVFRYSRVIWVHFERAADPVGTVNATLYEKVRLRELQEERGTRAAEGPLPGPTGPTSEQCKERRP